MDQTKALHQLIEVADLISMLEALTAPGMVDKLSSSNSWQGLRITLRNVRDAVLASHDSLAGQMISHARVTGFESAATPASVTTIVTSDALDGPTKSVAPPKAVTPANASNAAPSNANPVRLERRDLRAQLEKFIER